MTGKGIITILVLLLVRLNSDAQGLIGQKLMLEYGQGIEFGAMPHSNVIYHLGVKSYIIKVYRLTDDSTEKYDFTRIKYAFDSLNHLVLVKSLSRWRKKYKVSFQYDTLGHPIKMTSKWGRRVETIRQQPHSGDSIRVLLHFDHKYYICRYENNQLLMEGDEYGNYYRVYPNDTGLTYEFHDTYNIIDTLFDDIYHTPFYIYNKSDSIFGITSVYDKYNEDSTIKYHLVSGINYTELFVKDLMYFEKHYDKLHRLCFIKYVNTKEPFHWGCYAYYDSLNRVTAVKDEASNLLRTLTYEGDKPVPNAEVNYELRRGKAYKVYFYYKYY